MDLERNCLRHLCFKGMLSWIVVRQTVGGLEAVKQGIFSFSC